MRMFFCLMAAMTLFSFNVSLRKTITDKEYKYEFYTTQEKTTPNEKIIYHWFKGGAIQQSENGYSGELLQDKFVKYYLDNHIAEEGNFQRGARTGVWKNWYQNGRLQQRQYWKDGKQSGKFLSYDRNGVETEEGYYRDGKKHGRWIDFISHDTVLYKKGEVHVRKTSKLMSVFTKRTSAEKVSDSIAKAAKKATRHKKHQKAVTPKKKAASTKQGQQSPQNKKGVFKRLFSKKTTKQKSDGKGE